MRFEPSSGTRINAILIDNTAKSDTYTINGTLDNKPIRGELTIKLVDGTPDGHDWTGTELSDDERQAVLDLFADEYN